MSVYEQAFVSNLVSTPRQQTFLQRIRINAIMIEMAGKTKVDVLVLDGDSLVNALNILKGQKMVCKAAI